MILHVADIIDINALINTHLIMYNTHAAVTILCNDYLQHHTTASVTYIICSLQSYNLMYTVYHHNYDIEYIRGHLYTICLQD